MFPFSHSATPAVRSHLDAQVAFFNDMSKSLSHSFQNLCELNVQLGQTLLDEGNIAGQQLLTTDSATDLITIAAARAQPVADKLRAYQQHIARVVADTQIELARVSEQHAHVTSRTARDLADQVAQVVAEEAEKSKFKQQEIMKNAHAPFQQNGATGGNGSTGAHGNMQSAGQGADAGDDSTRSSAAIQGGEQGSKGSAKPN